MHPLVNLGLVLSVFAGGFAFVVALVRLAALFAAGGMSRRQQAS